MPKDNLQKHTLFLRRGDYERISDLFAAQGTPAAEVIRRIVSRFVDQYNAPPPKDLIDQIKGVDTDAEHG